MAALSIVVHDKSFPALGRAPARPVLRELRLDLHQGEVVAVIGPSGCGKTTLLHIVAGLDRDYEGRVERSGEGRLGYVFQEPRLLPWRTVRTNLALVSPADTRAQVIDEVLAEVGLSDAAEVFASRLSVGMARRAALARAFVVRPDLLLLDEPFVSLDEATARRLRELLQALLVRHRTTTLLVTHDLEEAISLADRIIVLAGVPASVVGEEPVNLSAAERRDPEVLERMRRRLLASHASLGVFADADAPAKKELA